MYAAGIVTATLTRVLALSLAFVSAGAVALSTDKDQPIEIEADNAQLDDTAGVTTYTGNVVVVQGSIRMTGDTLTVFYTPDRQIKEARLDGRPARFRQRPDRRDVDDEGEAIRVRYYASQDLLVLRDRAKLTQGERSFSGAEITYDTERSLIKAHGAAGAAPDAGGKPAEGGRVRIVLPPSRKKQAQ